MRFGMVVISSLILCSFVKFKKINIRKREYLVKYLLCLRRIKVLEALKKTIYQYRGIKEKLILIDK
jgi:hypothetical protein